MSKTNPLIKVIDATIDGEIDLTQEILGHPHVFIGIKFLDVSGVVVTPSGGTFSMQARINGSEVFEAITGATDIDATLPVPSSSYGGNADRFKYIPTAVTGAVSVQITLTGNKS